MAESCANGHSSEYRYRNTRQLRCRGCDREYGIKARITWSEERKEKQRSYNKEFTQKTVVDAIAKLGGRCSCCSSVVSLEFDHINPVSLKRQDRRSTYQDARSVLSGEPVFQLLCKSCNRWKSDGPFCPCPVWDEKSPGWRKEGK